MVALEVAASSCPEEKFQAVSDDAAGTIGGLAAKSA